MELTGFDVDLSDRVILITGRAVGSDVTARRYWSARVPLVPTDLAEDSITRVCAEMSASGALVKGYSSDVTSPEQIRDVVADAINEFGTVHGLVTAAGIHRTKPLLDIGLNGAK